MDADIQAMDGNQSAVQVLDSGDLPSHSFLSVDTGASVVSHSLPSLDAGFRHPCRKDGPPTLVYNDERSRVGMQPLPLLRFDTSDPGASPEAFPRRASLPLS